MRHCKEWQTPQGTSELELHLGSVSKSLKVTCHGLVHGRWPAPQYLQQYGWLLSVWFPLSNKLRGRLTSNLTFTWISVAGGGQWVWIISFDTNPTPPFHPSGGWAWIKTHSSHNNILLKYGKGISRAH